MPNSTTRFFSWLAPTAKLKCEQCVRVAFVCPFDQIAGRPHTLIINKETFCVSRKDHCIFIGARALRSPNLPMSNGFFECTCHNFGM